MTALRLAFSWLTVVPIAGPATVDRTSGGRAISAAPVVGAALGLAAAGLLYGLTRVGATTEIAALCAVAAVALLTRGMHLDGLADTFDGLGCYGPAERARAVMRSGGAGPFGVAAIVFAVAAQTFAFAALADAGRWWAVVVAVAAGRVTVVLACRIGMVPAPDSRFGTLVAGTQQLWVGVVWLIGLTALSIPTAEPFWLGPIAVLTAVTLSLLLAAHCVRRFGGLSGDVLGAAIEVTVAMCAVVASVG